MNKKLAILIFAILTLGLIVILVVFYNMAGNVKINKQELLKQDYTVSNGVVDAKKLEKSGSWVDKFAKKEELTYRFPATEIFIKLDLTEDIKNEPLYRILVDKLDNYQFFLLSKILKTLSKDMEYSYFKRDNNIKLIIMTSTEKTYKTLLNELDNYSIEYNLEK